MPALSQNKDPDKYGVSCDYVKQFCGYSAHRIRVKCRRRIKTQASCKKGKHLF